MARNTESGASQEQPNDARIDELQNKLRDQGADMALLKEQMASMTKMMENMTSLMQASMAATTAPPVIGGEGPGGSGILAGGVPSSPMPWGMPPAREGAAPNLNAPTNVTGLGAITEERSLPLPGMVTTTTRMAPTEGLKMGGATDQERIPAQRTPQVYATELSDYEIEEKVPEWKGEIERLNSMIKSLQGSHEHKFVSNVNDLCVFPRVEVPKKFKIPDFVKFDGSTNPEHHLRAYCSIMGNWSRNEDFLLAYFHTSLTGAAYSWYMRLDRATISSWSNMVQMFQKHYSFNILEAPTRDVLMTMGKKSSETFRDYAKRWRQTAMEVHPPLTDYEMKTYFIGTLGEPYRERMIGSGVEDFAKLVSIGEWIDREYKDGRIPGKKLAASGGKTKEEIVNYVQGNKNSQGQEGTLTTNYAGGHQNWSRSAPGNEEAKKKPERDNRPLPNFGITRTELFDRLCKMGLMCPKPGKAYQAPYPPWYKPELTCVYHMEAPGHSIETCEPFRWHVLSLLDANLVGIKGPNITTQPMPDHDKGKGAA